MARGRLRLLRRRPRRRGPRPRARHVVEISTGILLANIGDVINIFLAAYLAWALREYPVILALLPGLASVRGGIMSSMAARISTGLQLGTIEARVREALSREAPVVTGVTLLGTVMVAAMASPASGVSFPEATAVAGLSSLAVLAAMIPFAASVAVFVYKRGVNPDNVASPILTVVGDMITLPSLALGVILLEPHGRGVTGLAALAVLWAALTSGMASARVGGRSWSVMRDSLVAMALLGLLESGAGGILARWRETLYAAGLLHVVGSLLEDAGAAASVIASRASTLIHLYGPERASRHAPAMVAEALLGSLPGLAVLVLIGYASALLTGIPAAPVNLAVGLILGGSLIVVIGSAAGIALARLSFRFQLDPDTTSIPVVTSFVDLIGSLTLALIALAIG